MEENSFYEELIREADEYLDVINNRIINDYIRYHNIPNDKSVFHMKLELIAKTIYFLGVKKRYALKVFSSDGSSKIEMKGLVTRRTDYPSYTRDKIEELVSLILNENYSLERIDEFDRKTEEEFRRMAEEGLREVGRPVSYSKSDEQYKKKPPHVLGMELWNHMEIKTFIPGSKGYMFRIKGIDQTNDNVREKIKRVPDELLRCNYIVLPEDIERLPRYYIVDVDYVVKFGWIDRVDEILEPFGGRYDKRRNLKEENSIQEVLKRIFNNSRG